MEAPLVRHDSLVGDIELIKPIEPQVSTPRVGFFTLPAEIRTHIYELVFDPEETYNAAFRTHHVPNSCTLEPASLWPEYTPSTYLTPLLTSRQFYTEAHLLAFSRTLFVVRNPYIALDISDQLSTRLRPDQIASLRSIAFVADSRHFRKLVHWRTHPFGHPLLALDELTIILHRSSYWHYLFDFNVALCTLLRNLVGVRRLTFVRNNALVKGTLFTWYNRLVKLMLKMDRAERFEKSTPNPEVSWWDWSHCEEDQTVSLSLTGAKKQDLDVGEYETLMGPLYEALKVSMESEEEDPDPMSRVSVGL